MTDRLSLTDSTVAVTGGAGFVGSHVVELVADANDVVVVDDLSSGTRGNVPNSADLLEEDIKRITTSDLEGVDVLFHQAANISVPRSVDDPKFDAEENILGLLNVLDCAREAGVERVVFASSSAVYGDPRSLPLPESAEKRPGSPYAASKLAGEHYCTVYDSLHDIETVCLRYFNVYGPRQRGESPHTGVIAKFLHRIRNRAPLEIHGDGSQSRDFIYVEDVARANVLAATMDGISGETFNIGTGSAYTIAEVAERLDDITDRPTEIERTAPRKGDIPHSRADTTKAESLLGFTPSVPFEKGLRRTANWYENRPLDD